jgi:hypothetical protein
MASLLGAAFGMAISAALFTALSGLAPSLVPLSELFLGRTDNIVIRFAATVALLRNVLMVIISIVAIVITVPKDDPRSDPSPVRAARSSRNASLSAMAKPTLYCAVGTDIDLALGR